MLVFLFTGIAHAQNTQFLFDPNGNFLSLTPETATLPEILGQPQMQVIIPGNHASFSVGVADTSGVSYQWFFNSTAIPGANADSLLITNVSATNQGVYWVAVSNAVGSTASTLANLYIDSRGCGMPDSWQLYYFGNLNQPATGDYDGDGVSNLQEFLDGTNPTNAASALYQITLLNDGGTIVISPNQSAFTNGQVVTLTATSTNSNPFHAWTGDVTTRSNSITVAMTMNRTLFAHFLPFTLVWTNTASGDWNVAANWSPNLSPGSNESVVIATYATVTENSNVDLVDFTLGNSVFAPVLTGSGRITIAGTGIWNAGTMSGTGSTIVQPGASLSMANSSGLSLVNNRTLENAGLVYWVGGNFSLSGVLTNDPGGQIQFLNSASVNFGGGTARFDNAGTFIMASNAATTFAGVAFNDYGTVDFPGGTLTLGGGGILASSLSVPAGSVVNFESGIFTSTSNLSLTGPGTLIVNGGVATLAGTVNVSGSNIFGPAGSVDFTGNYICTNNTMLILGGSASFDGTGVVAPAFLTLNGTLGGAQNVTVGSALTWTGSAMNGTGWTIIPPGVTLAISNASSISMTSRTLDNRGTTIWSGASMTLNGAVITNESGALFQVQSPQLLSFGGGSPRFDNAGTFTTTGSGTTSVSGVLFNNFNTVQIQGGTLALTGGGNNTGSILVPGGTTLNLAGFSSSIGSSITGAGTLQVSGGFATLGGTINVTGSNVFSNGSVDFTGNYVCTNNMMVISGGSASFDGTGTLSPAVLNLSSGTLGGAQNVTVESAMNWTGGTMSGTGRTFIPQGVTLTISNASFISFTSRTLDNAGTITWPGGASMTMVGGVITNEPGSLFQVQSPASMGFGGGAPRFDNAGTFRTTGAGTTTFAAVNFNNYNDTQIQGGTLQLGGGLNNGTMEVPAGTTLNLGNGTFTSSAGSSITGAGNFTVNFATATLSGLVNLGGTNTFSNGSAELNGNYVCTNNSMLISGGSASFDGTGAVAPSTLTLSSGTLGGSNVVTVGNAMNWTGGSMSGTGRTVIPPGATLTIANPSVLTINNRTLDNGGTAVWTGAGNINLNAAVITNRVGALFNPQNSSPIFFGGGSSRFDNGGTFRKSVSTGTTTIGGSVPFTNYGTVDIQCGILVMSGGYASSSNAVLNCALAGTLPGTNYGQLQVSGATTLHGSLSVNFNNNYVPATNNAFTLVNAGTRNGVFASFVYPSNQVAMVLSNTASSVIAIVTNVIPVRPPPILYLAAMSSSTGRLYWSTNYPDYHLEYNPTLTSNTWAASGLTKAIIGTNFVVTNTLSGLQKYYRLSSVSPPYVPPPPALQIQLIFPAMVQLLWPVDYDRPFLLRSATNPNSANWTSVSPSPWIAGSNNVVTNAISGSQQFYRLSGQ